MKVLWVGEGFMALGIALNFVLPIPKWPPVPMHPDHGGEFLKRRERVARRLRIRAVTIAFFAFVGLGMIVAWVLINDWGLR